MSQSFRILYFASAAKHTGKDFENLPAPLPVNDLFDYLETRYPSFKENVLNSCAVTVGLDYVDADTGEDGNSGDGRVIQQGEEVAIIPPVSSG